MSQKLVPIVGVTDDTTGQLVGVKPDQSAGDITVLGQMSADAIADTLEDAKVSDPSALTRIQGLVSGAGITDAQAVSGSLPGALIGETRVLSDGANAGAQVRWYLPARYSAPCWCWDIYPQSKYQG